MQHVQRPVPPKTPIEHCDEMNVKDGYIFNVIQAFSDIAVGFEHKYSCGYTLKRLEQNMARVTFVVSSTVLTSTLIEINGIKSISLSEGHKTDVVNCVSGGNDVSIQTTEAISGNHFLVGCKKLFGNWKVDIQGTHSEVTDLATCLLMNQSKHYTYVTIEVSKSMYCKFQQTDTFKEIESVMTFIPTGYDGYLIDIGLHQENIREIVGDMMQLSDESPFVSAPITNRSILASMHDFEVQSRVTVNKPQLSFIRPITHQEKLIHLTKPEVSFLLGRNGHRIVDIRNKSGCLIYILPVPKSIEIIPSKKTSQIIKLVGSGDKIENACLLIEANLLLYKQSRARFL